MPHPSVRLLRYERRKTRFARPSAGRRHSGPVVPRGGRECPHHVQMFVAVRHNSIRRILEATLRGLIFFLLEKFAVCFAVNLRADFVVRIEKRAGRTVDLSTLTSRLLRL